MKNIRNYEKVIIDSFYTYFPEFKNFNLYGECYIIGGFITDIILGTNEKKDLDIVVINGSMENIIKNVEKNNLIYKYNSFNGIKIIINEKKIDIWASNRLEDNFEYNIEGIFFDIKKEKIVDLGFSSAIKNNKLEKITECNKGRNDVLRKKKIENRFKLYINKFKNI